MEERFVLVLVSLNPDGSDLSGFCYPKDGYIESRQYKADTNIRHGFYGTLWGQARDSNWLNPDPDGQWKVVRVEKNAEILYLDESLNLIKFRRGHVVFSGPQNSCGRYIMERAPEGMDLSETIAGDQYSVAKKQSLFASGAKSQVETASAGSHAVHVGSKGIAKAAGSMSHAIALGHKGEALCSGDECSAIALMKAIAKGKDSKAICMQDSGHVFAGRCGVGVGLGEGCTGCGEEGSVLILAARHGKRLRFSVGYVGEGLEPGVTYRLSQHGHFEEVKSPVSTGV